MKRTLLLAVLSLVVTPSLARAQATQGTAQAEGVMWYRVSYAKFKPGMAAEARRIIYDHFWAVDKEIGREVIPFDVATGEWDHIVYFPMPGGPGELAFEDTPLGKRWQETLARREGGKDKAEALQKRFGEMILREQTEVVRRRIR